MKASDILANAVFQTALVEAHADQANASHFSDKSMTLKLAVYYQDQLKETWDHLEALSTANKYSLGGNAGKFQRLRSLRPRLPDAFNLFAAAFAGDNRLKLLGHLGSLLDQVVNHYHIGKVHTDADIAPLKATDNPQTFAHYGIAKVGGNFRRNLTLLCDRLLLDWEDIEILFYQGRKNDLGLEDTCLKQLKKILTTGSDPHKGGKQAYILTFSAVPKQAPARAPARTGPPVAADAALGGGALGRTNTNAINLSHWPDQWLVYKPGDMELDTRIVGCTEIIKARLAGRPEPDWQRKLPDLSKKSLFECANADNPGLDLAVYRLLPRGCASVASREQNLKLRGADEGVKHCKPVPVQEAYGYIEFLAHRPSWKDLPGASADAIRDSDYITESEDEIKRFYRHHGWMLGLGHLIGMADAHQENARVFKRRLHLIDNEICFKIQGPSGFQMMLPQQIESARANKNECILYRKKGASIKASFIPDDPTDTSASDAALQGIQEAIDYIKSDPQGRVRGWITDPALATTVARITLRATTDFGSNRNAFWKIAAPLTLPGNVDDPASGVHGGPRSTAAGVDVENPPFTWKVYLKAWYDASSDNDRNPLFAASAPGFDWTCYLNDDYPCHYKRLGSMDVMSARGEPFHIYQPLTPPGAVGADNDRQICGPRYFQGYGAARLFTVTETRAAPLVSQLDDRGQGLNALLPYFNDMKVPLVGPTYRVVTRGRRWKIIEPRLAGGYWNIERISPDGAPLKLWVQLCRHDDDWKAVRALYKEPDLENKVRSKFQPMITGVADGPDVPEDKITPSRLDADPKTHLKALIVRGGLKVRQKLIGSGSKGEKITPGAQWRLVEKENGPYWFAQDNSAGSFRVPVSLVRDASDHPAPGAPYAQTTPTGFTIPVSIQTNDLNRDPLAVMSPHFAQNGINLSPAATGHIDRNSELWHIKDGTEVYHLRRGTPTTVDVNVATTAVDMVRRLYDRLKNDTFATQTRETLQKDARAVFERAAIRIVTLR